VSVAAIALCGVSKRFGRTPVVEDVDLRIAEGEFFTLVGPSGCGKSTLVSLIAGLDRPSAGTIRFDDETVTDRPPRERDVAMVFQSYALYPHMTVAENIAFPLRLRNWPHADVAAAVARVARSLGIEALLARRPHELSGGQRQRVALGRALVRRPRVFLLDEPLSNLDARLRLEMRAELKRLHAEYQITTVYVTHDQEEAMALSDRAAVLNGGRIQQCDAPMTLYDEPANLFVAGFIGSPPINTLDAESLAGIVRLPPQTPSRGAVVGIRPADVHVSAEPSACALPVDVTVCEPTGSDLWVIGRWRRHSLTGRGRVGERPAPGDTVYFELAPDRLHVFDGASGARLARARGE
jgi:multiple sugar transport system ATP-binding protein